MNIRTNPLGLAAALALLVGATGCDQAPVAPENNTLSSAPVARAATPGDPISGQLFVVEALARPDQSVTPGGTTRYRGTVFLVELTGDVTGEFVAVQTSNWNKYGNGALKGETEGTLTWNGRTGDVHGTIVLPVRDFVLSGNWVFHGEGELAGHKLQMRLAGPLGCFPEAPCDYTGFVTVPASAD